MVDVLDVIRIGPVQVEPTESRHTKKPTSKAATEAAFYLGEP